VYFCTYVPNEAISKCGVVIKLQKYFYKEVIHSGRGCQKFPFQRTRLPHSMPAITVCWDSLTSSAFFLNPFQYMPLAHFRIILAWKNILFFATYYKIKFFLFFRLLLSRIDGHHCSHSLCCEGSFPE
jgi:hypothetical protein